MARPPEKFECLIGRIEHHPMGLVLMLDIPENNHEERPHFFLRAPRVSPKIGDTVKMSGKNGVIRSGELEYRVHRYAPNGLEQLGKDLPDA